MKKIIFLALALVLIPLVSEARDVDYFGAEDSGTGSAEAVTADITALTGKVTVITSLFLASDQATPVLTIQEAATSNYTTVFTATTDVKSYEATPIFVSTRGFNVRVLLSRDSAAGIIVGGEYIR